MTTVPIADIVALVGGVYGGRLDTVVTAVAPLADAGSEHLSFLSNSKYASLLPETSAGAVLVPHATQGDDPRWIRVDDPYYAMATVVGRWFAVVPAPHGLSERASIAATATLGRNPAIGPFVVIGENVVIGDDVTIYQGVSIEEGSSIGDGSVIYPNCTIYHRSVIGRRCTVQANVVIGSDGFGFAQHGGRHHKIPQVGIVRIGDDVEIGAGTTIDRAALGETVIGDGTKIDNLVQIAHNVKVGKHCLLVSQVGIAGSTELGDYVVVAGQSGFAGHLKIGSRVQVAAKSAVLDDVPDGVKVMGSPAIPFRDFARREVMLKRLIQRKR